MNWTNRDVPWPSRRGWWGRERPPTRVLSLTKAPLPPYVPHLTGLYGGVINKAELLMMRVANIIMTSIKCFFQTH